jgi:hypothetical protein
MKEAEVGAVAARRLTRFFQDYFADTMTEIPACGINEPHARAAV